MKAVFTKPESLTDLGPILLGHALSSSEALDETTWPHAQELGPMLQN